MKFFAELISESLVPMLLFYLIVLIIIIIVLAILPIPRKLKGSVAGIMFLLAVYFYFF